MRKVLKFEENGLKGLHFFTEKINFPVVAASYSDSEKSQLSCLETNVKSGGFTTEAICKWCIHHHVQYQILYPLKKISIIKNPYKYYQYLMLKRKLNKYSL